MIRAALRAVDAGALVERWLSDTRLLSDGGHDVPETWHVIAAGKAAPGMAAAAWRLLGRRIRAGLVVSPAEERLAPPFEGIVGGHPVPTVGSERAGRRALAIAHAANREQGLLVLLSGGASALMAAPAEGVTLEDKRRTTDVLLRAGADIRALNTVRKHLSAIKGGWLGVASGASCLTLAISDVVGDDLSVIASGPTVPDETTFEAALEVVRRWGGLDAHAPAVVAALTAGARGDRAETPKPDDPRLASSRAIVIGERRDAMSGAAAEARARDYRVVTLDTPVVGEARDAARGHLAAVAARAATLDRPLCIVSSGETTVRVTGSGRGGRNQEFALAAASGLDALGACAVLGSVGTDGVDGPTDAAGALVDSTTQERARAAGLSPAAFLENNDTYAFFTALGDLVHTGPTGTNVGDLQILLVASERAG